MNNNARNTMNTSLKDARIKSLVAKAQKDIFNDAIEKAARYIEKTWPAESQKPSKKIPVVKVQPTVQSDWKAPKHCNPVINAMSIAETKNLLVKLLTDRAEFKEKKDLIKS